MLRKFSCVGSKKRLSNEGQKLFCGSSDEPSTKVSVVKMKRLLYSIFYTQDDAYIDNLLVNCRKASKYLLGDVEDESTPAFIDRFIFNAITLIFKDEEKVAKFHTSKLKYKLFLKLGEKALASGDHNTAWLMRNVLLNTAVVNCKFSSKKMHEVYFFSRTGKLYGEYNHSFQNHILDCTEVHGDAQTIEGEGYLPIVAVLRMYTKRCNAFLTATQRMSHMNTSAQENKLRHIESVIDRYTGHYKQYRRQDPLMPLYTQNCKLPGEDEIREIGFSDLIKLSKLVRDSAPKSRWKGKHNSRFLKRTKNSDLP